MLPFLQRFARPVLDRADAALLPFTSYDTEQELKVLPDGTAAISEPSLAVLMTGSECTKASTDPTRDEPIDRL